MFITINQNREHVNHYFNMQIACKLMTLDQAKQTYRNTLKEIEHVEVILVDIGGLDLLRKASVTLMLDGFCLEIKGVEGNILRNTATYYKCEAYAQEWDDAIRFDTWEEAIRYMVKPV